MYPVSVPARPEDQDQWLRCFHRGDRWSFAHCYEEHLGGVAWAVGQVLSGVDRETVVQDVFCRLFAEEDLRRNFTGGNFGAWIITVARRQAIDFRRKRDRERPTDPHRLQQAEEAAQPESGPDRSAELRSLVERFLTILPVKWHGVFRARFLDHLDQRSAAARLGLRRTTLAYQEMQIRRRLRRFVLEQDR